jgi:hypothetical protein
MGGWVWTEPSKPPLMNGLYGPHRLVSGWTSLVILTWKFSRKWKLCYHFCFGWKRSIPQKFCFCFHFAKSPFLVLFFFLQKSWNISAPFLPTCNANQNWSHGKRAQHCAATPRPDAARHWSSTRDGLARLGGTHHWSWTNADDAFAWCPSTRASCVHRSYPEPTARVFLYGLGNANYFSLCCAKQRCRQLGLYGYVKVRGVAASARMAPRFWL